MGAIGKGAAEGAGTGAALGPWGAAGGAVLGAVGGIEAGKQADKYQDQQFNTLAADKTARDAFMAKQNATFQPIQTQLTQEAANPNPLNYGQMAGQINQTADQSNRRMDAGMAARGMTGSGLQAGALQGNEMGRTGALAGAFQTGLQARQQLGMGLLQHYNPLGNAQFGQSALGQNMAFGQNQQVLGINAANNAWGAAGKGLGALTTLMSNPNQSPGIQGSMGQGLGLGNTQGSGAGEQQGAQSYWSQPGNNYTPYGAPASTGPTSFTPDTNGMISGGLNLPQDGFQMPTMGSDLNGMQDMFGGLGSMFGGA